MASLCNDSESVPVRPLKESHLESVSLVSAFGVLHSRAQGCPGVQSSVVAVGTDLVWLLCSVTRQGL